MKRRNPDVQGGDDPPSKQMFGQALVRGGAEGNECEDMYVDAMEDVDGEVIDCADEWEDPEKGEKLTRETELMAMEDAAPEPETKIWSEADGLQEGEELVHDPKAYDMLHQLIMEWPCLSFDFIPDQLGAHRSTFPHELFFAAGTQASQSDKNKVLLCHAQDLHCTRNDGDSSDDDDDDDVLDDDPVLAWRELPCYGAVNRVRVCPHKPNIISAWLETGNVVMLDANSELNALGYYPGSQSAQNPSGSSGSSGKKKKKKKSSATLQTFQGHNMEGYAMDWSKVVPGAYLSGDCEGAIYLWHPNGGKWKVEDTAFKGHEGSVEDIQWNPSDNVTFGSCGVDRTIRLWDCREPQKSLLCLKEAHTQDINVMSWNAKMPNLIVSGGDEGTFKIWDLRKTAKSKKPTPFIEMSFHKQPITSIEWHPHDESVLVLTSADNTTTLWDMDMKKDPEEICHADAPQVPAQLLFVHRGQQDVKEVRWHPQIPGLMGTTAANNFHLFKTINSA
mmetsp:Transcript_22212/g.62416  ORF Transcript_22212/g.62416 Transcript_22212/m.62416 type:complete len:503 (+) Transcript_22212:64-1572(+)|eukprot:CAMPEP_0119122094 /NCGR_PEP_ID=MMETSP1310-20130426/2457_1 /TAXON_ID=464262 /ORGANISM="Genus nov. species nov., Strain RCC2339" /LENGTH=502 /DNA_ID=CAMNT_0007111703 /DNA_START=183 /DNA_END=1691 /DNA_ORIENTATION=+